MKNKNNKLTIDVFFYLLINIILLVLFIDYLVFFFQLNYFLTLVLSFVFVSLFNVLIWKKQWIQLTNNIEKSDIFFFVLLVLIMIITIPYPDRSWDTFNYHLYLQEHPFGNKLTFDFLAGRDLNSFTYALPDRLFYLFRYFLGYRLGTLLNYFLMVVMYYQVKRLFKRFIANKNASLLITFFTIFSILGLSLIDIVDSYYVDLISIPLLLETLEIALFSDKLVKKDKKNTIIFAYIAFLFGVAFTTKISNAFLIILIFIIYVVKHPNIFKCLTIKNVLITILCFTLPFVLYMVYTYQQTGNPVFPFYNTIFHSKYYFDKNWLDLRFGPKGKKELLLWPLLILKYPNRCVDQAIVEPIWAYGYVVAILYIGYYCTCKLKDKNYHIPQNKLAFFITVFLFYLVWSKFILGYSRYGLVVLVLGSIATFIFIYDLFKHKKMFLLACSVPFLIYNMAYSSNNYMYNQYYWVFNNSFNNKKNTYYYNAKNLLETGNINLELEGNAAWVVVDYNSGLLQTINNKLPMLNLWDLGESRVNSKFLSERLGSYNKLYTAVDSSVYDEFLTLLSKFNYKIVDVVKVISHPILGNPNHFVYVFEIASTESFTNEEKTFYDSLVVDTKKCKNEHISMFVSISYTLNNYYDFDFKVVVYGRKKDTLTKITEAKVTRDGKVARIDEVIDSTKYDQIEIRPEYEEDLPDGSLWITVLNYESVCE